MLLWASALDRPWSDLPLKPVFLLFVQQAMQYLAAYTEPQPWLTVGQVLDPSVAAGQKAGNGARVVLTPSNQRLPLQDEGSDVLELTEQGFYEVRSAGGAASDVAVIASNVDPAEGDLTPMDIRRTSRSRRPHRPVQRAPGSSAPMTPEAQERNQRLWWYLLCAGALVLGAETLMSNRMAKA